MEKSFKTIVEASRSLLILLPSEADFDYVASALALYLALEGKKDVSISCPTPMRVEMNRLVGVDKVGEEVGSKNMVLRFEGYPAEQIERVSYDIENQEFRLTVVPKPQMEAPKKEQVKIAYSGVAADTAVLIGGRSAEEFPALTSNELAETKVVHIGVTDIDSPKNKSVISLARPASSVSEIMAEYIKELEGGFHPDIATNLLSGLYEGSNNFSKKEVNANTFKLAGELMAAGGKYSRKEEFRPKVPFDFRSMMRGLPTQAGVGPMPILQTMKGAKKLDDISPERDTHEAPEGEVVNAPKDWLKAPKIYSGNKGTSVS